MNSLLLRFLFLAIVAFGDYTGVSPAKSEDHSIGIKDTWDALSVADFDRLPDDLIYVPAYLQPAQQFIRFLKCLFQEKFIEAFGKAHLSTMCSLACESPAYWENVLARHGLSTLIAPSFELFATRNHVVVPSTTVATRLTRKVVRYLQKSVKETTGGTLAETTASFNPTVHTYFPGYDSNFEDMDAKKYQERRRFLNYLLALPKSRIEKKNIFLKPADGPPYRVKNHQHCMTLFTELRTKILCGAGYMNYEANFISVIGAVNRFFQLIGHMVARNIEAPIKLPMDLLATISDRCRDKSQFLLAHAAMNALKSVLGPISRTDLFHVMAALNDKSYLGNIATESQ